MVHGAPFPQSSLPAKIDLFNEAIVCEFWYLFQSMPASNRVHGPHDAGQEQGSENESFEIKGFEKWV